MRAPESAPPVPVAGEQGHELEVVCPGRAGLRPAQSVEEVPFRRAIYTLYRTTPELSFGTL
jgi:hypothetical protein